MEVGLRCSREREAKRGSEFQERVSSKLDAMLNKYLVLKDNGSRDMEYFSYNRKAENGSGVGLIGMVQGALKAVLT